MARIGDSRLVFGATDEVWGYIQNLTEDIESSKSEAKNGAGNVIAVETTNVGQKEVKGDYLFLDGQTGTPLELIGSATGMTLQDVTGTIYISKCSKPRKQGDWLVVSFSGTHYPHLVNS